MLSKFHHNLISQVKALNCNDYECVVFSSNFSKTKLSLEKLNIDYTSYPFTDSFYVKTTYNNLLEISELSSVVFLTGITKVSTQIKQAKEDICIKLYHENKYLGENISVAFIDTGISPHIDFIFPKNRIVEFVDLINKKKSPYDDNGHGTYVASICGGSGKRTNDHYTGISPMINIVAIKALNHKGEADSNKILDAMQYIYDNHKRLNIKVVCMSFGADYLGVNDPLIKGANSLWNKGLVVVVAAGNSGPKEKTIKSPGACSKIITVGGLDNSDKDNLKVADFSSRGPTQSRFKPDLIAPSVNIIGANIDTKNPYIKMSGTSVATPIVAGISAIMLQKNPTLTPDRLKYLLINNCTPINHEKNSEGFGYINFNNQKF